MGGSGSGRSYCRATTSAYRQIDIRIWHRQGYLEGARYFRLEWSRDGQAVASIGVRCEPDRVILRYHQQRGEDWEAEEYAVLLEWTRCNYGGQRPWFLCPARGCGRRVAILYLGNIFACRHCYQLAYDSQREAAHHRAMMRAQKIRVKLGGLPGLAQRFPPKPKGMHWRTYERLRAEVDRAADLSVPPQIREMFLSPRVR